MCLQSLLMCCKEKKRHMPAYSRLNRSFLGPCKNACHASFKEEPRLENHMNHVAYEDDTN